MHYISVQLLKVIMHYIPAFQDRGSIRYLLTCHLASCLKTSGSHTALASLILPPFSSFFKAASTA